MMLAAPQVQAESLVDGSAEAGKNKAITCAACHGAAGISANPLWPNIAGQAAPYLVTQLQAFKDGTRQNPLMSSQAMMLSEQDMADLAVYFESLPAPAQAVADPDLVDLVASAYGEMFGESEVVVGDDVIVGVDVEVELGNSFLDTVMAS